MKKAVYISPSGLVTPVEVLEHDGETVRVLTEPDNVVSISARRIVYADTFEDFQAEVLRTAAPSGSAELDSAIFALGLAGEAGEVADLLKKHLGHGHELDVDHVKKELGDVLWYVARIAMHFGLGLDDVARANIVKLRTRYPQGFSTSASKARVDVKV